MTTIQATGLMRNLPPPEVLTPAQSAALERLQRAAQAPGVATLLGRPGSGKSTILRTLHGSLGGVLLKASDGLAAILEADPAAIEEALVRRLEQAFEQSDLVIFDDEGMFEHMGGTAFDRPFYLQNLLKDFASRLQASGQRLVVATEFLATLHQGGVTVEIKAFDKADYAMIFAAHLPEPLPAGDVERIFRAYKQLSGEQIALVSRLARCSPDPSPTGQLVLSLLDTFVSHGNVDIEDVEPVTLEGLVGVGDIVAELQRTVLIPMTQPELARALGLKPKRGVLLYGEPGTGKTTIGRALAHSMKGKFLMIDGSFIPGSQFFYHKIDAVLKAAELNSPSVIFIDDADVIFQHGEMAGLARKLLSRLDGLQSESQSDICVVMTAMNVADMPPALLRSGRVEVWLDMRLPDAGQRWEIIQSYAGDLVGDLGKPDQDEVCAVTEGFTPADLRGLVGDARGHMAYDRHKGRVDQRFDAYLKLAAADVSARKALLGPRHPQAA